MVKDNECIKKLFKNNGISAYRYAKETGTDPKTVSKWLKGLSYPRDYNLSQLSEYFDVPLNYFDEYSFSSTIGKHEPFDKYIPIIPDWSDLKTREELEQWYNNHYKNKLEYKPEYDNEFIVKSTNLKYFGWLRQRPLLFKSIPESYHVCRHYLKDTNKAMIISIAHKYDYSYEYYVVDNLYSNVFEKGASNYGEPDIRDLINLILKFAYPEMTGEEMRSLFSYLAMYRTNLGNEMRNNTDNWQMIVSRTQNAIFNASTYSNLNPREMSYIEHLRWIVNVAKTITLADFYLSLSEIHEYIKHHLYALKLIQSLVYSIDYEHINMCCNEEELYNLIDYMGHLYNKYNT